LRIREEFKALRQAFAVQVAYQATVNWLNPSDKEKFAKSVVTTVAQFQEDLTHATCIGFYKEDPEEPGVQLDKPLVKG